MLHRWREAVGQPYIRRFAKDRGCSLPGCAVPANLCEAHHCNPSAINPVTDVNDLTLACGPNHKLAEQGWTTRKNHNGDTGWIPPPHLDRGQARVNTFHHPEKLLLGEEDNDDDEERRAG